MPELSLADIKNCSLSYIVVLVRMVFLPKRALDRAYNSVRAMGLVFLHLDLDDVHLHGGFV